MPKKKAPRHEPRDGARVVFGRRAESGAAGGVISGVSRLSTRLATLSGFALRLEDIQNPPDEVGEYQDPDYENDPDTGTPKPVEGGDSATCTNTVYYDYNALFTTRETDCTKVPAVAILLAINDAMNTALDRAKAICTPIKNCPKAQRRVTYRRWDCRVQGGAAVVGVKVQVRVRCRATE